MKQIHPQTKYTCRLLSTCLLSLVSFLVLALGCSPEPSLPHHMIRGGWVSKNDTGGVLSNDARQSAQKLWKLGVRWLALGPEVIMKDVHRPAISFGEQDKLFREFIRWARKQGFQVMLLPRIESPSFFKPPFPYRADIQMLASDHWDAFFRNYEKMLIHYGKLCEEEGVEIFAIGLEYLTLVKQYPNRWRNMIKSVRKVYSGKITYSANWYEEYEAVTFWDALDLIGVGAYFELKVSENASLQELLEAWQPIVANLQKVAQRYNKPILFTEVGYNSFADAAMFPWKWQVDQTRPISFQHQADCYQAMFQTFSNQPWFYGLFVWRFYTRPDLLPTYDYNPIGKPSESVLQQWFRKGAP